MSELSEVERRIYDNGCRYVPGIAHDERGWIRHRNRYEFAKNVIIADLPRRMYIPFLAARPVSILDLGCGIGYGSAILAAIPGSTVLGVDTSPEAIRYASQHYQKSNMEYRVCEASDCLEDAQGWDYAVANEVIEHLEDGFEIISRMKFGKRAVVSTPYRESPGRNRHHRLFNITEETYSNFHGMEFYYTDRDGSVHDREHKPEVPLNLICVLSRDAPTRLRALRLPSFQEQWPGASVQRLVRRLLPSPAYRALRCAWRRLRRGARG